MALLTYLEGLSLIAVLALGVYAAAVAALVVLVLYGLEPNLRDFGRRAKELAIFCLLTLAVAIFKLTSWLSRFVRVHGQAISKAKAWGALVLGVTLAGLVVLIGTLAIADALLSPGRA